MSQSRAFGQSLDEAVEAQVDAILDEMSLEEKVGQMVGTPALEDVEQAKREIREHHLGSVHFGGTPHNTPAEKAEFANEVQQAALDSSRFDIPLFLRAMAEHGHAAVAGSTVFPQQLGLGATRNPEIAAESAKIAAREMRATGVQSTSSPIGDVARDQRWGRIAETFSESPYLCARLTEAMVGGYQGDHTSDLDERVLAVTKHFPAYSEMTRGEDQAPNEISEYTLRRVHVPPYKAGIDAGTAGIMPCYNAINGEPVHGSKRFMTDLLRQDLGFDGFVLADYRGAEKLDGGHNTSGSLEESLWQSIRGGMDLFPSGGAEYAERIVNLVEDGELSERRIEESARRILRTKFELGLFDDPLVDVDEAVTTLAADDHREVAREAVRQSMTLLKNDGDILPIADDADDILVAGPNADDIAHQHGGWGNVEDPRPMGDTILDGIEERADAEVTYEQGTTINEALDVDGAAAKAEDADIAIVAVGEPAYVHEFRDATEGGEREEFPKRSQLTLPDAQLDLVKSIHETGTPTVVVFVTGRVLATPWIAEHIPSVLMAYQPGSEGKAVADVLFGDHNPSGKLPISIPKSEGHVPTLFNHLAHPMIGHEAHEESYDPLFEYGHGLSYTEFEYRDLALSKDEVGPDDVIEVEVTVANVGDRSGTEVVEVLTNDVLSSRVTPIRELKGFDRVELDAGEQQAVTFELDVEDLGVMQDDGTRVAEPGEFEVFVDDLVETFEVTRRRSYER